ncbi:kinesin-like protein KIF28 isoform X2 [Dreissena polymorpha]|uniref:kinesin-like protein KIF28 isoform X2 n=1 Tax=Dreissena polymorpha TaxID=45954 RepID=UPI0022641014|nr:kinesin-like protein KIF28 isoform X2 [Dreissena polymorpha]
MALEAVKVAVRVRPFNQREIDRQAKCVIKMDGQMTMIYNPDAPNEDPKKFSFDYSYWSHDGFRMTPDGSAEPVRGSTYACQRTVFDDLGQGVLNNAFEGYNCSLFAYGQTGSGKSYSVVGYGVNRGIIPITCDELFKTMSTNNDPNKRYEVLFSMLEIYNEQVRDLLSKDNPKGGLNVRQNPKLGMFYVEGLKKVPVGSYSEIEKRMEQGTQSRTVASTNMNATSSRAHTVVTIVFDQIIKTNNGETKKSSTMNLVDLAGSERADSTGATGDRLKEGANINKSLSALGNVISALADLSMGKKKVMVPYRDSILTKLLQNALGGNSKTIMIAALSPADINYDETLSTLRYADRAKKIQNKAVINENPLDKLIRELKEENDRLRRAMEGGGMTFKQEAGMSPEDIDRMRRQMEEEIRAQLLANQQLLEESENTQTWDQKLAAAQQETDALDEGSKMDRRKMDIHLINLNEDPMLSGVIVHFVKDGQTTIGRNDAEHAQSICLSGLSIQKEHAVLMCKNNIVEIEPVSGSGSKTKVNGVPLTTKKKLVHKDRLLFGSNHLYVFMNPKKTEVTEDLPAEITWEFAQKEIAQVKGFATAMGAGMSKDQQIAQEQVLEILPMVSEVNAISEELNKHKSFEVVLISAAAQEAAYGTTTSTSVTVKMKNLLNENTWLWERGKFMNRRYLIQDLYQKFLDGDDISKIPKEEDPFWEPTEDVMIGSANVFLQSLSYALDFEDKIMVTDYKGQEEGFIVIHVAPCQKDGKPLEEEAFVDNPKELLGKPYHFKVTVKHGEIFKSRFLKGIQVKYRVYKDKDLTETKLMKNTLKPEFKHSKMFSFNKITKEHLEFFEGGCITFMVYGTQEDTVPDPKLLNYTTRELRQMELGQGPAHAGVTRRNTHFALETASDQSHLKTEVLLLQRKYERLAAKERRMQDICKEWESKPASEKQFEPFYRAVSAVAHSSGTRLKTRVVLLNQIMKAEKYLQERRASQPINADANDISNKKHKNTNVEDDVISIYAFGEEEDDLCNEAEQNGGMITYEKVKHLHHKDLQLTRSKSFMDVRLSSVWNPHSFCFDILFAHVGF